MDNHPKNEVTIAIKELTKRQDATIKTIKELTANHIKAIEGLIYRCGALEAIQVRLFSALAETNPEIHSIIVDELRDSLEYVELKGGQDSAFADHLRSLVGAQPGKKVHLKLVSKKSPPDFP